MLFTQLLEYVLGYNKQEGPASICVYLFAKPIYACIMRSNEGFLMHHPLQIKPASVSATLACQMEASLNLSDLFHISIWGGAQRKHY